MSKVMGLDEFVWFQGVVEDRDDPLKLGRCRVRCLGFHSDKKSEIPTDMLPWAYPMQPLTSAAMSGVGTSPTGLVPGSWVFGFFRDGVSAQEPVIMGSLGGMPEIKADPEKGFNDPEGKYPLEDSLGEPSTSRLARNEKIETTIIQLKKDGLSKGIQKAQCGEWNEPETPYGAEYPYNHVKQTESGHIEEWDDTPGKERLHRYHKAGTFEEIHPDGTKVTKVVKDKYDITKGDDYKHVEGGSQITVDGDAKIFVRSNVDLTCDGDMFANIGGDFRQNVDGSMRVAVQGTYTLSSAAGITLNAPRVDFNPNGGVEQLNGACASDTGGAKEEKTKARRSDEFESNDPQNAIPDFLLDAVQDFIAGGAGGLAAGLLGGDSDGSGANLAAGGVVQTIAGPAGPQGPQGVAGVDGVSGSGTGLATGSSLWDGYDSVGGQTIDGGSNKTIIVNFNEALATDSVTFSYDSTDDELTINSIGRYLVMYRVATVLHSGTKKIINRTVLEKDVGSGFSTIAGTDGYIYNHVNPLDSVNIGEGNVHVSAILDITVPGTKIRVKALQHAVEDDGTGECKTIANGSGLSVMDLERALFGISGGAAAATTTSLDIAYLPTTTASKPNSAQQNFVVSVGSDGNYAQRNFVNLPTGNVIANQVFAGGLSGGGIGCALVVSGCSYLSGDVHITGGDLLIDGVTVTSSATELNLLDGKTSVVTGGNVSQFANDSNYLTGFVQNGLTVTGGLVITGGDIVLREDTAISIGGDSEKIVFNGSSAQIEMQANEVFFNHRLQHYGDSDTGIQFDTNVVNIHAGNIATNKIQVNTNTVEMVSGLHITGGITIHEGDSNFSDVTVSRPTLKDYAETVNAGGSKSASFNVDFEDGNVQTFTFADDLTVSFTNPPASGKAGTVTLIITNGGANTTTFHSSVKWPSDVAPSLTASGVDIVSFMTIDAGTTIYGFVGGLNFS